MIRFDQVSKRYPNGREALSGVSFKIDSGELAFLTGHSGAGKSSILKLIALIERPTRGQVFVDNHNTGSIEPRGIAPFRRLIGVVFQDHKLLHDRPVGDNVALPLIVAGVPRREIDKRVRAALDQVGLLSKEKCRPLELSTGEQQRVGIARAVVARPKLLIADEPTGNLDPDLALEIMQLFKRFNDVGATVVIATHDVHLIERFAARRIVLEEGRVRAEQAPGAGPAAAQRAVGERVAGERVANGRVAGESAANGGAAGERVATERAAAELTAHPRAAAPRAGAS